MIASFPSELGPALEWGGSVSGKVRALDEAADEFLKRAAATDPERFARIAARYPTIPLRALERPRRVQVSGERHEIRDVHDNDDQSSVERHLHRVWLEDTWS